MPKKNTNGVVNDSEFDDVDDLPASDFEDEDKDESLPLDDVDGEIDGLEEEEAESDGLSSDDEDGLSDASSEDGDDESVEEGEIGDLPEEEKGEEEVVKPRKSRKPKKVVKPKKEAAKLKKAVKTKKAVKPKKEAAKPVKESGKRTLAYTKKERARRVALEPDHLGSEVKRLREKLGWTQTKVAEHIGRCPGWISFMEAGIRPSTGKRFTMSKESETLLRNFCKEARAELKSKRKGGKADAKEDKKKVAKKKVVTVSKGRTNKKTSEMIGTIEQPPKKRGRPKGSKNKK